MTHGNLRILPLAPDHPNRRVHLHTSSDGHDQNTVDSFLHLPQTILFLGRQQLVSNFLRRRTRGKGGVAFRLPNEDWWAYQWGAEIDTLDFEAVKIDAEGKFHVPTRAASWKTINYTFNNIVRLAGGICMETVASMLILCRAGKWWIVNATGSDDEYFGVSLPDAAVPTILVDDRTGTLTLRMPLEPKDALGMKYFYDDVKPPLLTVIDRLNKDLVDCVGDAEASARIISYVYGESHADGSATSYSVTYNLDLIYRALLLRDFRLLEAGESLDFINPRL